MKVVTLDGLTRIQINGLLFAQKGTLGEMEVLRACREKVKFPPKEERLYLKEIPGSTVAIIDKEALLAVTDVEVEFENDEVKRLLALLESWQHFGDQDLDWVVPLRRQLKADPIATMPRPAAAKATPKVPK